DPFPVVTAAAPLLDVSVGTGGTRTVALASRPATLDDARRLLEDAIRGVSGSPAFAAARVVTSGSQLLIVAGEQGANVTVAAAPGDATSAGELALTGRAQQVTGLLSGDLGAFPTLAT